MPQTLPLEIFFIYFSPHTAHTIELNGKTYPTVEHAYQCQRYTDEKIVQEIINAKSPVKAWETSCKYKHLQIPEFKNEEYKPKIMKQLMELKTEQHEDVKQALIDSGDMQIVKHITTYPPGDGFWDDGKNGEGLNHMGKIWMEIRDKIKTQI